jgi:uncharacterized tellurite resistance protein B-like protein
MFGKLLDGLFGPEPERLGPRDARLAMTALMVRVARTDGNYDPAEIAAIDRTTRKRYGLSPFEAAALRAQAEQLEAQAPDTVRFTRAIKSVVPYEERIAVIEALWAVALADGERDDEENALMRLLAPLLGVSDLDSNLARQKAEHGK